MSLPVQGQGATVRRGAEPRMTARAARLDDAAAVVVPLNRRPLTPLPPERIRRLRRHLIEALRALARVRQPERAASPLRPAPSGIAGEVAATACELCRGWCCRNGGEDAYLDERTLARVRLARPALDARAVLRLYLESVPAVSHQDSCIFHGEAGCTLSRSLRSDVCNSYFCAGLEKWLRAGHRLPGAVTVTAQDGAVRASCRIASDDS